MRMCSFIMPWRESRLMRYHSGVLVNGYITRYLSRVVESGSISCAERAFVYWDGRVKPHSESTGRTRWRKGVVTRLNFSKKSEAVQVSGAFIAHHTNRSARASVF